ncbi:penicillin-binding protein 1C [Candidatus Poribacteria bacterium]|nr:penicillin-binding protein 1C [Candidatus Poribacteria bacterium]MYG05313.1 penicillin-binding protein 1C [Candidatus Poribacteria bacterium]MYK23391.1 penicillin-binding protein 1C [Candidatus Poribacteria bacterium]
MMKRHSHHPLVEMAFSRPRKSYDRDHRDGVLPTQSAVSKDASVTKRLFSFLKVSDSRWLMAILPLFIIVLFTIASWCFPLPKTRLHAPPSRIVLDRNGEWLRAFLAKDGMWRFSYQSSVVSHQLRGDSVGQEISLTDNRKLKTENPWLHEAMLTTEDRWFYYHCGINPVSMVTALYDNVKAGEVVRGGSTITMQLARLMEPKARNVPNKLIEMFRALQLELAYSKSEILNFYFNMLPYGGNIVGTGAASRFYFNKPQHAISLGEAALLAAIPNAPERLRPDRFPENARHARAKVLNRLRAHGQISEQQWQEALREPIPTKRYPLPFKAPHLSRMLANGSRWNTDSTTDGRIYTTIDAKVQETAVRILREYLNASAAGIADSRRLQSHTASTGAIVVMDTQSRQVLAMVGSHDFFDQKASGQINGTLASRSPGSTLKPFVYALGIEQGLITPETLLFDVPVTYSGYEPVNYDGTYNGYVTARQALARSLNVPAVNLHARLKNRTLHAFLKQAGISTLAPAKKYGLSMVLGGCEVNLLELTTLYAGLANMGKFAPYQIVISGQQQSENLLADSRGKPGETQGYSQRLLRKETSFIITEMLTTSQLPVNTVKNPEAFEVTMNLPKIAWKTGTSYGHRDAWCIGYSPKLTIGVWLGNFDGKGAPMLSGADAATPVVFALFNALTRQDTHRWFTRPEQLKMREVCALTGAPPSVHCPTRKNDVYIPGISSVKACAIHKRIYIDEVTGYSLCSHCRNLPTTNLNYLAVKSSRVLLQAPFLSPSSITLRTTVFEKKRDIAWNEVESGSTELNVKTTNELHRTARKFKIFEEWPAEAATWLAKNGFAVPVLPKHNPLCTGTIAGTAPVILSPTEDTVYYIRDGIPLEQQKIQLSASTSNRTQQLFWFLDGELIFKGNAGQPHWLTPVKGEHVLTCVDAEGRSASRPLHISIF